jgi:hypothetical protein
MACIYRRRNSLFFPINSLNEILGAGMTLECQKVPAFLYAVDVTWLTR